MDNVVKRIYRISKDNLIVAERLSRYQYVAFHNDNGYYIIGVLQNEKENNRKILGLRRR